MVLPTLQVSGGLWAVSAHCGTRAAAGRPPARAQVTGLELLTDAQGGTSLRLDYGVADCTAQSLALPLRDALALLRRGAANANANAGSARRASRPTVAEATLVLGQR